MKSAVGHARAKDTNLLVVAPTIDTGIAPRKVESLDSTANVDERAGRSCTALIERGTAGRCAVCARYVCGLNCAIKSKGVLR